MKKFKTSQLATWSKTYFTVYNTLLDGSSLNHLFVVGVIKSTFCSEWNLSFHFLKVKVHIISLSVCFSLPYEAAFNSNSCCIRETEQFLVGALYALTYGLLVHSMWISSNKGCEAKGWGVNASGTWENEDPFCDSAQNAIQKYFGYFTILL